MLMVKVPVDWTKVEVTPLPVPLEESPRPSPTGVKVLPRGHRYRQFVDVRG